MADDKIADDVGGSLAGTNRGTQSISHKRTELRLCQREEQSGRARGHDGDDERRSLSIIAEVALISSTEDLPTIQHSCVMSARSFI